jgi:hypothetical protein
MNFLGWTAWGSRHGRFDNCIIDGVSSEKFQVTQFKEWNGSVFRLSHQSLSRRIKVSPVNNLIVKKKKFYITVNLIC